MAFGDLPTSGSQDSHHSAVGLLTQIAGLCRQYIGLDETTPLKSEAESFLNQVEDGIDKLKGEQDSAAEDAHDAAAEHVHESPASSPGDFRSATKAAHQRMTSDGNFGAKKGGTKTGEEPEQSQDEEHKKKTKAGY